jgi:hypothetical protein
MLLAEPLEEDQGAGTGYVQGVDGAKEGDLYQQIGLLAEPGRDTLIFIA